ncbi:hypothetical protein M9Y10_037850 [Tritrichomonas musculus]|uniref:CRC domain-containing protein n=1 Tax=Tritrichomonas musculus TaxID=1915356 RepID=A0ABR2K8J1_9EUKA
MTQAPPETDKNQQQPQAQIQPNQPAVQQPHPSTIQQPTVIPPIQQQPTVIPTQQPPAAPVVQAIPAAQQQPPPQIQINHPAVQQPQTSAIQQPTVIPPIQQPPSAQPPQAAPMAQPQAQAQPQQQPPKEEERVCSCESNCLTLDCPCFRRGRYCDHTCNCKKCKNNEEHAEERLEAIEQILSRDPMAFTAEETLNQEECQSICNFAMLTSSVDAEPFKVVQRDSPLSRLLTPDVINQAIRTVMSAANDDLKSATSENFEEHAENSVSKEFENVLITIVNHVKPAAPEQT